MGNEHIATGEPGRRFAVASAPSLDEALAGLGMVVLVAGPDDECLDVSVESAAIPCHPVPGRRVGEDLPETERNRLREALRATRGTGRRQTIHLSVPTRAGTLVIAATTAPLEGGCVGVHLTEAAPRVAAEPVPTSRVEENRRLLDASPVILYRTALHPDGTVEPLDVSDNVTRLLGYPPGEPLVAGWWAGHVHAADLDAALAALGELVRAGEGVVEYRFRHRDGSWRLIRDEMWLERREDGSPARILGAWSDITAQRRTEERFREREARLRAILAAEPDCIKVIAPDGWLEEMNPAGLAMLEGASLEEVRSRPLIEFVEPADREPFQALHARAMRGGSGSVLLRIRGLRGAQRTVECQAMPLRDGSGRVVSALCVSRDVTEKHRAEQALRDSRARLEVAVATAGLAVWQRDLEAGVAVWDDRMFELYNRPRDLGPPSREEFQKLVHPDDLPVLHDAQQRTTQTGEPVSIEYRTNPAAGPQRHLAVAFRRVEYGTRPGGYLVGTVLDRTRERELEEQFRQAQKLESIGRLAGGVAHDFNNLLTAILGHAELLEPELDDEDLARHVRGIRKSGERARDLTRQLLAFARRQVVAPRIVDLAAQLREAQSMLRRLVGEDVELVLDAGAGLWPVLADPGQIEQIILNLAVNARDAMPKGGRLSFQTGNVLLTDEDVTAHPGLAPGPHVMLSVADTGTGMGADVLAHIFEPFFTTKPAGVGTGLGLATVYGIVRQSGGHIRVTSERDEGTTFEIFLPRAEPQSAAPDPSPELQPARQERPPTETLLVVEDDPSVRELVELSLADAGYRLLSAPGPREALEQAARHEGVIHLLVTDVVMPGMNGLDLAEALTARRPELKVLLVSGYPGDTLARHGLEGEENLSFLPKPFSLTALLERVREVLDGIIAPS